MKGNNFHKHTEIIFKFVQPFIALKCTNLCFKEIPVGGANTQHVQCINNLKQYTGKQLT